MVVIQKYEVHLYNDHDVTNTLQMSAMKSDEQVKNRYTPCGYMSAYEIKIISIYNGNGESYMY